VSVLVDDFLDLIFFFGGFLLGDRFIVFLDQPLHLFAIDIQHLVGLGLGRLRAPFAIQIVLDIALDIGVVALFLVVLDVVRSDFLDEISDLLRAEAAGDGRQRWTIGFGGDDRGRPR